MNLSTSSSKNSPKEAKATNEKVVDVTTVFAFYKQSVIDLTQQRFERAIRSILRTEGHQITDKEDADLLLVSHLEVKETRQIVTDYQMVGLYPYHYGFAITYPTTREYRYDEGRLIIDGIKPRSHKIVWRGIAIDHLKNHQTPQERMAYIQQVVVKILATLPLCRSNRSH